MKRGLWRKSPSTNTCYHLSDDMACFDWIINKIEASVNFRSPTICIDDNFFVSGGRYLIE